MSKRFTDTEKWRDPWFRKLSPGAKLAFYYILDNCDCAGVWNCDTELANFTIGMNIPWDKVTEAFGERIKILPNGRWWITRFVEFQYGVLSPDCRPHNPVFTALKKHGIDLSELPKPGGERVLIGYSKGINTLKDKDKEKNKGKDKARAASIEEAISFCVECGLPKADGEYFWWKCEGCLWTNGGKPIRDWKATVRAWKSANYFPSQKQLARGTPAQTPPAPPAKAPRPLGDDFRAYVDSRDNEKITEESKNWKTEADLPLSIRDGFATWAATNKK